MAKTYYGYVKRDVENQVDWSAITKSMVDTLDTEYKRREEKKEAIDKASTQFGQTLSGAEGSSHLGLNEFWLNSANSVQEMRRIQDGLLKRGLLDYKSYIKQRQNLTDGANDLISVVKGFDNKWKAVKDDPDSSVFDYWNLGNVQGFGNFTDYQSWVNPTDGKISLGKLVLNPKTGQKELSQSENDFKQISFLKNRMAQRAPKYDYDSAIKKVVDNLGKYVTAEAVGAASTIADVRRSKNYQEQINNWINFMVDNPFNAGSMLTDAFGFAKNYSDNPEELKEVGEDGIETYVKVKTDETQPGSGLVTPEISEKQKEKLKKTLRQEIESRLDYIETAAPRYRPNAYEERSRDQVAIDTQNTTAWGQLYYGTPDEQQQGANRLLASPIARREDLIDIDVRTEPGKVILRYKDSTKDRKIDMLDDAGNPISFSDYMSLGNEVHGVDDYGKAVQLSGRSEATYNIDRKGRATRAGKANLYNDPETIVTFKGKKRVPKDIIEEDISSEIDEDTIKTVSDVFSVLNLPKPRIQVGEGKPYFEYKTIGRQTTRIPLEGKEKSLEITFPGVSTINIPEGEDFQDILDKIIENLDASFKSNTEVSVDEIKAAFPTLEMFELYNPGFAKETTEAGEKLKKPLPGKKE